MSIGNIRIISLTDAGEQLAKRLSHSLAKLDILNNTELSLWHKPQPFTEKVQQAFNQGDALVMICATGIVMRTLAPVIKNKHQDPPVLVLDEYGKFVIPLLSGHEGGANDLAAKIAESINGQLVLTTANSYVQPIYTVGMGCERGCPEEDLQQLLDKALTQVGLSIDDIANISSIDIKADELGLQKLAATLGKPFTTFTVPELSTVQSLLSTQSEYVFKTVGVYGVAESAALVAAQQSTGKPAELMLHKIKSKTATCAIARSFAADIQ